MNWLRTLTTMLMALVLAVAVWFYAVDRTNETERFTLPVSVSLADATGVQVELETTRVEVVLKGPRGTIDRVRTSGIMRGPIKLTETDLPSDIQKPIVYRAPLQRRHLGNVSDSVDVTFNPDTVTLRLAPTAPFTVKVRADVASDLAGGFTVDTENIVIQPPTVQAIGPANLKQVVENPVIETAPIPINGISTPQTMTFNTVPLKQRVGDVPVRAETLVKVIVPIVREQITDTKKNVPVRLNILPDYPHEIELNDHVVTIKVRGVREDVEALTPEQIVTALPITGEQPRPVPYAKPLIVIFPDNLDVQLEGDPPTVNFEVLKKETQAPPTPE